MSKFKNKKKGELPAISTASLPDIVFMLLFFFMVATVMRDNTLLIKNSLPNANQVEKLKKDRTTFIYIGEPADRFNGKYGTEARVQINDKFSSLEGIGLAVQEYVTGLNEEFKDKFVVALKVDKEANAGLVSDVKQELRKANALKIMYVTGEGEVEE
ncbi:biopolymer transporter ExbD [Winogradskyella sp. 3972H.M.0a.05]|uniref:ExbD/TolR family protein n=1 Tax=Winogradskyella sp. 3972H.M.0a.05 TaxID=2950277 RepID=UPI003392E0DA